MSDSNLQKKALSSLMWKYFEKSGAQILGFIVSIVLARLLAPDDYGSIALINVFISFVQIFINGGFSTALIRKKDADELDYSSVFYCSLVIAIIMYVLMYFIAPYVAEFYEIPELTNLLRVLALISVLGTYNSMQSVILTRKFLFKKLFLSSFGAIIIAGIISIALAYAGFGTWALVAQQLITVITTSVIMTFTVKWRPKLLFSFERIKILFSFGSKLLISNLMENLYQNIYSLIIGKKYSATNLAYWNKSKQFPMLIVSNINGTVSDVMFPLLSKFQDNKKELKAIVSRSIRTNAYLIFPLLMGLAVCAEPVVRILLTDKWLACVPFLQGWCFINAWKPIHSINLITFKAMGRSDIFLNLEIVKKIIGITILVITLPFGLDVMMIGLMVNTILASVINAYPNSKILGYGYFEQLKDILPSIVLTISMGIIVSTVTLLNLSIWATLIIQIIVGVIVYMLLSVVFKVKIFYYLMEIIIKYFKKDKC